MKIQWRRFNFFLLGLLALALVFGCSSPERQRKKQVAVLRIHMEGRADFTNRTQTITFHRDPALLLTVEKSCILSEENVKSAKIAEAVGGFGLEIRFDREGTMLLDAATGANRGKHLAVLCAFGPKAKDMAQRTRCLAAPQITTHITDGVLQFTPDCTRDEAEQIVIGLNNAAKKYQDKEPNW